MKTRWGQSYELFGVFSNVGLIVIGILLSAQTVFVEETQDAKREAFVVNGFQPGIPGIKTLADVSQEAIIKQFGRPLKSSSGTAPDVRGMDIVWEGLIWEYRGLLVKWNREYKMNEDWRLTQITVTDRKFKLKYGLRIGQPKPRFEKVLGAPSTESYGRFVYGSDDSAAFADFTVDTNDGDKVTAITWIYNAVD